MSVAFSCILYSKCITVQKQWIWDNFCQLGLHQWLFSILRINYPYILQRFVTSQEQYVYHCFKATSYRTNRTDRNCSGTVFEITVVVASACTHCDVTTLSAPDHCSPFSGWQTDSQRAHASSTLHTKKWPHYFVFIFWITPSKINRYE